MSLLDNFNFEKFAPIFARDEDAFILAVVGYAVQNIGRRRMLALGEDALEVDNTLDDACLGVDDYDFVGGVDVRPDLTLDPLQFIEKMDGVALVGDRYGRYALETLGFDGREACRAIGHIELAAVGRKSPALARVAVNLRAAAAVAVVDVGFVVGPGELVDLVAEQGDALAKLTLGKLGNHVSLAGGQVDALQSRMAVLTRALPHHTVHILQTLRVACS